jgi:hypothetical protein
LRVVLITHNFSKVLDFLWPYEERHTGVLLAKKLDDIMESIELAQDCFKARTTGDAANTRVACTESNTIDQSIECFAHTLNLIVNSGTKKL